MDILENTIGQATSLQTLQLPKRIKISSQKMFLKDKEHFLLVDLSRLYFQLKSSVTKSRFQIFPVECTFSWETVGYWISVSFCSIPKASKMKLQMVETANNSTWLKARRFFALARRMQWRSAITAHLALQEGWHIKATFLYIIKICKVLQYTRSNKI